MWRAAFAGVDRVIYWPFALPDSRIAAAPGWLAAALADLGIEARVDAWPSLEGHHPDDLDAADLLFVGGGTTSKLARHVRDYGFAQAVRDYVADGGRYYGGSAGALLASDSIALSALSDGDADAAMQDGGLGLVPGITVLPHADTVAVEDQHRWSIKLGRRLLAVPEASGVRISGPVCAVLGPEPVDVVDGPRRASYPLGAVIALGTTSDAIRQGLG